MDICKVLLLVIAASTIAEAHQSRGRMLLQHDLTLKKQETYKGSTPASYKSESKTTGEWKSESKTVHKDKGPATYSSKTTSPAKSSESSYKSEYKGSEQPTSSTTNTGKGGTVFVYNSGKRHFEYTENSRSVVNFPSTTVLASGGTPAEITSTTVVMGPVYQAKKVYSSGDGPSYKQTWSLDSEPPKGPAPKGPAPKRSRV